MNIRDLKYIVAVAKEGHFAKAANQVFVSQPTLSMQIKKLEEELGITIFERSKKNFLVTKAGAEIIKKAEIILREAEEIKNIAKNSRDQYVGDFVIGAFPTLAPYFLPQITAKINKKFPKLKLFLVEEKTEKLISELKSGRIDAALLAMPIIDEDFDSIQIFEEDFLLAVSKKHELAQKKEVKLRDLKEKELMLLEDGHCLRDQALEICSMAGALAQQSFKATSLETLRQMVAVGSGITLIPEIAAKKDNKISYIKINHAPKRRIGLFFRKTSVRKELIREMAKNM